MLFVKTTTPCVDPEVGQSLAGYLRDELDDRRRSRFRNHLCDCPSCLINVEAYEKVTAFVNSHPRARTAA